MSDSTPTTPTTPETPASPPPPIEAAKAPTVPSASPLGGTQGDASLSGEPGESTTPVGDEGAGESTTPAEGADSLTPESYQLQLPEGFEVNEDALTLFKTTLAEAGVKTEAAQKLFDIYAAQQQANATAFADTVSQWHTEAQADPVIGGEKLPEVTAAIGRMLDQYGTQEARTAFDATGAGWNPHIIKFIYNMASQLSEGRQLPQGDPVAQHKKGSDPSTWYPKMNPTQ